MIKFLHRLLLISLLLLPFAADAQRKTFYIDTDFPEFTHANGGKTVAEAGVNGATKYPNAYAWWTKILSQPAATFNNLTLASAVLNEAHWAGNGSGFNAGAMSTSRNNVERIPGGVYMVNVGITVLQGRFIGGGTSIGDGRSSNPAGNASTELVYDHARWMDPRPIRAVILSANWGTSTYLESCYISDVRVNGSGPHWKDNTYDQHGIALQIMGETAIIDRVYVENCNGHGAWVNGSGPGEIRNMSSFDNALAGLYLTSEKSGGTNGNSLGFIKVGFLSTDNNAWSILNRNGPAMAIGYLKNEDGLSAQRGRPKKGQVCIEAHGWVNIHATQITHAINGASGPAFVVNSTANRSRLRVEQYSVVANNGDINVGSSALVADVRSKQAWRTPNQNSQDLAVMEFLWTALGTSSTFICSETVTSIPFSGTTRLGVATTYAGYDYANATPVWDPTGGAVVVPPPTPCAYTYTSWGECVNGTQTRMVVTATPTGCTGNPGPLSQPCTVTPPPTTTTAINPNDVVVVVNTQDVPRTITVDGKEVQYIGSAAMATAYMTAWGIPLTNIVQAQLGVNEELTTKATLDALRASVAAKGKEYTVLAFTYPSRYTGGQSITSAVTFGARNVSSLTVSPLYGYTGTKPRTDKGFAPSALLRSVNYIRRDVHKSNPTGTAYMVLANDQHTACASNCGSVNCSPRGKARRGQTAPGLVVWDNVCTSIQGGNNGCNSLSTTCWYKDNGVPRTLQPVIANYGSGPSQCCDDGVVWRKGYYGDHVTSTGGTLPTGAGQTPLTYHMDRGASFSVGTVTEPWQDRSGNSPGSLVEQFVDVSRFHPLFVAGHPVGAAAWSAVKCADRALFVGDLMFQTK